MDQNKELLQKLYDCAAACENCMDGCLGEDNVKMMVDCIRLDRDCAKICLTTASLIASHSENAEKFVAACAEICNRCADECEKHDDDHCKKCAEACRACAQACLNYSGINA